MAKSRKPAAAKTAVLTSTEDLSGDPNNPRKIKAAAASGLSHSLQKFGDLSGIVFNLKTKELVAGHQRLDRIHSQWGKQSIELVDEAAGIYGIRIDEEHFFPVRVVNWSRAKQRAANVAANNQKIAGEFTDELEQYLLEISDDLKTEMGDNVFGDLLLLESTLKDESSAEVEIVSTFQVLIECADEKQQQELYLRMKSEGRDCKVLTL